MKLSLFYLSRLAAIVLVGVSSVFGQVEGPNGHYYQVIIEPGVSWEVAKLKAAESVFNGVHGYLATISSAEEDAFIEGLRQEAAPAGYGSLWVGGSQMVNAFSSTEGWFWVNGEGEIPMPGSDLGYANWQPTEPNDYWGPQSERFLSIGHFNNFGWNDEPDDGHIHGYVVEYPGRGISATLKVVATDPIAIENGLNDGPADTATFEFSRDGDLSLDLPVFYSIHGTALNGFDYNEISRSIIIPAGQTSVTLTIVPRTDNLTVIEPMETVGIRIEPSLINTSAAAYYIDSPQREAAAVIYEGRAPRNGAIEIGVPRNGFAYKAGEAVTVLAVAYYSEPIPTVDFYAGVSKIGSASRSGQSSGLSFFEFTWNNPIGGSHDLTARAVIAGTQFISSAITVSIQATAQIPVVSIQFIEPTTTEPWPDADFARGYLEVTRTGTSSQDLQVFYSVGGTATANVDYEALQGYVVIGAGRTKARISVLAMDDLVDEPDETVTVTLVPPGTTSDPVTPSNYSIDPALGSAKVVIRDNDDPGEIPTVSIRVVSGQTPEPRPEEDVAPAVFALRRTGSTTSPLLVYLTYSGTATKGLDYLSRGEAIEIAAGKAEVLVEIYAEDDTLVERDETVVVKISPGPAGIPPSYQPDPEHNTATLILRDNDSTPGQVIVSVEATDPEATEFPRGAEGYNPARFKLSRTGDLTQNLQVFFSLHGTAQNGEDYQTLPNSMTIPAGTAFIELTVVPVSNNHDTFVHHYEVVAASGISWDSARQQAEQAVFNGVNGHLATITSAEEDAAIETLRQEAGGPVLWVGGYQDPGETAITGGWKWVNNEGSIPGHNSAPGYANWLPNEPNDYWGQGSENHMVIGWLSTFGWNDQGANIGAAGYVVEFDIPTPAPMEDEIMETVAVRLEPSPAANPLPGYAVDSQYRTAAAIIFEHQAPAGGAIEVAFPSHGTIFPRRGEVEFFAVAYHPTLDIEQVDYYIDGQKVGASILTNLDPAIGGIIAHSLKWTSATSGRFTLQVKTTLPGGQVLSSSPIEFAVENDGANQNPTVTLLQPEDGAVFLVGDMVEVRARASDADGTIASIDLFLDGNFAGTSTGPALQLSLQKIPAGRHTIYARTFDNLGALGISPAVHFLVRHPDTVSFVHRRLPPTYSPLVPFTVQLQADPPEGAHVYAVEDRPPAGWHIVEVSHEGVFDAVTGKVKFGPFTDGATRTLSYRLTPPANASGRYQFAGDGSVNGALYPITGDESIELVQQYHPADRDQNWSIVLSEVTAYAAAWKQGDSWPSGPVPIPVSYVTRGGAIWKRGEAYHFDASRPAPACWAPDSEPRVAAFTVHAVTAAERTLSAELAAGAATQVQIMIAPAAGTTCHALEEKPPRDWIISNISHNGTYDPETGVIRWGAFFDTTQRMLTYTVTPPAGVSYVGGFSGRLSFDGQLAEISASRSITIEASVPIEITNWMQTPEGVTLQITGPAGQTAVIESSADFTSWTELKSIFIPNGGIEFVDKSSAPSSYRFYRLRVQ